MVKTAQNRSFILVIILIGMTACTSISEKQEIQASRLDGRIYSFSSGGRVGGDEYYVGIPFKHHPRILFQARQVIFLNLNHPNLNLFNGEPLPPKIYSAREAQALRRGEQVDNIKLRFMEREGLIHMVELLQYHENGVVSFQNYVLCSK